MMIGPVTAGMKLYQKVNAFIDINHYTHLKNIDALYAERSQIHEKILKYIPQEIKEPVENLTNAVKMI